MDIAHLETFLAVVRHCSFTRAAEALDITQSGATRQVQRLEEEIGVPLLRRGRGDVQPTEDGQRFAVYAQSVVDGYRTFRRTPEAAQAGTAGDLRIAASTTPGEFLVPGLLSCFLERHPQVRPQVVIADTAEVVEQLRAGRHDVGFTGARLPGSGLRYVPVVDDEVVLATPAGHMFSGREEVPLAELANQAFIEREGGSGTLRSVHQILKQRGLKHPPHRVVMVLSNTEAVVSAVESGYGIGWVSARALEHRDLSRVTAVRLAGLQLHRPLFLVHRTTGELSAAAAAFVAWARASAIR